MQMNVGQVPTMFYDPEPVVNDTRANTVPDAELQTMFPEQFTADAPVPVTNAGGFFADPKTWFFIGAAIVVWWAMRPGRR